MISIGLCNIKNPYNFGSICRLAGCYGASSVIYQGDRFLKHSTDTTKFWRHNSIIRSDNLIKSKPIGSKLISVELTDNASNLVDFVHPKSAFVVVGGEDSGIDQNILDNSDFTVYIPTKHCLNVSMALNLVLYDRIVKGINDRR